MRTTTNNPNPRGDLIGEFAVETSDLVVCFLGVNDEAGGERDVRSATLAGIAAVYYRTDAAPPEDRLAVAGHDVVDADTG